MTGTQIKEWNIWKNDVPDENGRIISEILTLWENYHKKYREYPEECRQLLEEREALGLKKPKVPAKSVIRNYPKNFIYEYESREKLSRYLKTLSLEQLKLHRNIAERLKTNYEFNTIVAFVEDARILVKNAKDKKAAKEAPIPDYLKQDMSFIF